MASRDWIYDKGTRRFRDERTGRFVSQARITELRNTLIESQRQRVSDLAARLTNKSITVQRWEYEMRGAVKDLLGGQYIFGRGGRNAMTQADFGRTGNIVKTQYGYLHQFAADIAMGELSEAQIAARAQMYIDAGTYAHSRGREAAFEGELVLPAHPGDGGTPCLSNCRCEWSIVERDDRWEATWVLHSANHCSGCAGRAAEWAPFVAEKVAV